MARILQFPMPDKITVERYLRLVKIRIEQSQYQQMWEEYQHGCK